jgi:hypothetical protein
MKKIEYNIKVDNYSHPEMMYKTIYMKRETDNVDYHIIFTINNIIKSHPAVYETNKQYILEIPKNGICKTYDNKNNVELKYNDILYDIDRFEYIDLFRIFVENDGVKPNEIKKGLLL